MELMVNIEDAQVHFSDSYGEYKHSTVDVETSIEQLILRAEKTIHLICFSMPTERESWWLFPSLDRKMKDPIKNIKLTVHSHHSSEAENLVRRYENCSGWSYKPTNDSDFFHIKAIIVDGKYIYIGSANFSDNAINNSTEWGIVAYSADTCIELEKFLRFLENNGRFERI